MPLVDLLRSGAIFQKVNHYFRQIIQRSSVPNNNFILQWMHNVCGKKTCTECKRNSVSIREIDVQTSYETTSVGFQTKYQPVDTRVNINLRYCSIMADYINLIITLSSCKPIKVCGYTQPFRRFTSLQFVWS